MRVIVVATLFLAAPSQAADPLSAELKACRSYCKAQDKAMLGLKTAKFDGTYARACVCKPLPPKPVRQKAEAAEAMAPAAAADMMRAAPRAMGRHDEAPVDEGFAVGSIDCDSEAVRACLSRPTRYRAPVGDLPAKLPPSGEFDVTIIEVSDFECPFCARAQETLRQLKTGRFADRIRFVYAHNPLGFHRRAMPAAIAAEAARQQGQFWAMQELLFSDTKRLSDDDFRRYAEQIGLDMVAFERAILDPGTRARVQAQVKRFNAIGARGTPMFYINGRVLKGAQPLAAFEKEIRFAIGDAQRVRQRMGINDSEMVYRQLIARGKTTAEEPKPAAAPARKKVPEFVPIEAQADPIRGLGRWPAPVVMVAFSDYECPFCARAHKTVRALRKKYGDQLYVIHRHLPLSFHKRAKPAARAAEAAGRQGKFWEMSDLLYANQRALSDEDLLGYARKLRLNTTKFLADMKSEEVTTAITEDVSKAGEVSVRGTPNFFINGVHVAGAQPQPHFEGIIDEQLKKAKAAKKSGVPADKLYQHLIELGGS